MPPGHLEWRRLGRILMDGARYYQSQISPNTQSHPRITEALIGFQPRLFSSASSFGLSYDAAYSREESSGYLLCMLLRDEGPELLHGCPSSTHGNHIFHTCRCEQRHGCLLEGLKRLRRGSRIPQGFSLPFSSRLFSLVPCSCPHLSPTSFGGDGLLFFFWVAWIESRLSLSLSRSLVHHRAMWKLL